MIIGLIFNVAEAEMLYLFFFSIRAEESSKERRVHHLGGVPWLSESCESIMQDSLSFVIHSGLGLVFFHELKKLWSGWNSHQGSHFVESYYRENVTTCWGNFNFLLLFLLSAMTALSIAGGGDKHNGIVGEEKLLRRTLCHIYFGDNRSWTGNAFSFLFNIRRIACQEKNSVHNDDLPVSMGKSACHSQY